MPNGPRIGIVGAGPAGITTGKNLLQVGLDNFVIYEKGVRIGGNWVYSAVPGHSSVYQFTRTISSKSVSNFQDFPFPRHYPPYPSHAQMAEYFESYARRFGLLKHIRFGSEIVRAEKLADGSWHVHLGDGSSEPCDVLLVCSGHHWSARIPSYPGVFSGRSLHSREFKNCDPFFNQRVLVIGGGNSGCEIAVELARSAKAVALSLRRGYHVIPKFILGVPSDVILSWVSWIPRPLLRRLAGLLVRIANGDGRGGMPKPDHLMFESHPVVNSEIVRYGRERRITVFPDVERFDGRDVWFRDRRVAQFDAIVFCTGYDVKFPFLGPEFSGIESGDTPLYLHMAPPGIPSLFFMGLFQPTGSIWPLVDLQAKLAANYLAGNYRFPAGIDERARAQSAANRRSFLETPRHAIEVDYYQFRRELLRQIPRSAPVWSKSLAP